MEAGAGNKAGARVLLTCGRTPFSLDLIRAFTARGDTVFVADSWAIQFGSASRRIDRSFLVPEPNRDPVAYARALRTIVAENSITHVIPGSEEVFFVAAAAPTMPAGVRVVVDSLAQLRRLHNKYEMNRLAREWGLKVPDTVLCQSGPELRDAIEGFRSRGKDFVLKPVYSRFADRVILSWRPESAARERSVRPSADDPWIVQERVKGVEVCSYSVCEDGKVLVHVNYTRSFTAGVGAAVSFEAVENAALFEWVARFVALARFSGQIAFDFIIDELSGEPHALECNPRGTNGIHLFSDDFGPLADALITGRTTGIVSPRPGTRGMTTAAAVALYGIGQIESWARAREWLSVLFRTRDAIFDLADPGPYFAQFRMLFRLWRESRARRVSMLAVSTRDIEWNGRPIPVD